MGSIKAPPKTIHHVLGLLLSL
uniref:Uncharacterized protein n=1 Tax=Anguilla anguilla TaxID=7936 RepID=A0A0E9UPX7_ANGAN